MANPAADFTVEVVADSGTKVTLVGNQLLEATPADVGKVVSVAGDGSLVLSDPGAAAHPNLDAHDTLGLAKQTELDAEAADRAAADLLLLPKAGGTLTGPLVLPGDAAAPLQATPLQQVQALIAELVTGSPDLLNTLNELAAAIGDDPNFAATTATLIGEKVAKSLYDAFTVLAADVDNVPAPVTMAANTVLARLAAGGIVAATPAQLRTLLGTGTTDATTFLRGDGTWQTVAGGSDLSAVPFVTTAASGLLSAEKVLGADVIMRGVLADRPAPGTAGRRYIVDDDDGGTEFHDTGASWVQVAPGLTEAPAPHGFSTHGPNGSDAWTKFARKTADESVTSSTVVQDDNELFISVAANEVWKFWLDLHYEAVAGGGITMGWTVPVGATGRWGSHGLNLTSTTNTDSIIVKSASTITDTLSNGGAGTADVMSLITGLVVVGGTGGTLRLQWAQRTSSPTATTVFTHSSLYAVRVA